MTTIDRSPGIRIVPFSPPMSLEHVPVDRRDDAKRRWQEFAERMEQRATILRSWLARIGGTIEEPTGRLAIWRAHPADVVEALANDGATYLSLEGVCDIAMCNVFGGDNHAHCDNGFLVEVLVPHARMPVDGFVLYADRDVKR